MKQRRNFPQSHDTAVRFPGGDHQRRCFFADAPDLEREARQAALEVLRRALVWMAEGPTLENRGLRASVALYCIRPDLINDATMEQIGDIAGCSLQAVHQLTESFCLTTGFTA